MSGGLLENLQKVLYRWQRHLFYVVRTVAPLAIWNNARWQHEPRYIRTDGANRKTYMHALLHSNISNQQKLRLKKNLHFVRKCAADCLTLVSLSFCSECKQARARRTSAQQHTHKRKGPKTNFILFISDTQNTISLNLWEPCVLYIGRPRSATIQMLHFIYF
jgi:hypothetical protein